MNRLLLLLVLLQCVVCVYAENDPEAGILKIDGTKNYDISSYLSFYREGDAAISPGLAYRYFEAGKYRPIGRTNNEYINDGLVSKRSWIAIRVQNILPYESSLALESVLSDINSLECYTVNSQQQLKFLARESDNQARGSGSLLARPAIFNLNLQSREEVLLLMHVVNNGQLLYIPARAYDLNYFAEYDSDKHNFLGIFQGIFFFIIIFNLLLYLTTFDKVYLLYLLYAFLISVFALNEAGTASYSLGFLPFLNHFSGQAFLFGGFSIWLLLMLQFLNVTKTSQSLYWLTIALVLIDGSLAVVPYLVNPFGWNRSTSFQGFYQAAVTILFAANLVLIVVANILRILKGSKLAIFYAVANIPVLTGSILYYGVYYNFFTIRFGPLNPVALGLSIETFAISFGFAYRYNLMNREKQSLLLHINEQQRETARQIIHAQELERQRIAQDVHDELGGNLAAIKMTAQSFHLEEERSQWLCMLIDKASVNARAIAHNLMPPEFSETGLEDILSNHFGRLNQEGTIRFRLHYSGQNSSFTKQDELIIYRIIMELVNNCIRHALATEITLQLIYHPDQLAIMVEDNGRGFPHPRSGKGMGLNNVTSRVNYLQGQLKIDTGANGTTVMIQIPYKQDA